MTQQHDPLIAEIRDAWAPPPTEAGRFEVGLQRRLQRQRRRRAAALGGAVALALLVGASHLLGVLAEPEPEPLARQVVVEPAPAQAVASAERTGGASFFSGALQYERGGLDLPGAYGALDSLFLQDQEL